MAKKKSADALVGELASHLAELKSAPFLFIGAGLSRRYLDLDNWEGLLRRFAALTGKPYAYYASSSNGDYPATASVLAEDFHEMWWSDPRFEESRALFGDSAQNRESALKIEISRYIADSLANLKTEGVPGDELKLLAHSVIDGIITTNYDPLLKIVFPDFKVFVGQDELLFSDPQGVGEIYQIHGSCERPDSLVLTAADYERFKRRNPYLAAKLLTIFVEHPVIFLGYSLSDPNIIDLINAIASVLTNADIGKLQDRLIFVQWVPGASTSSLTRTALSVGGHTIPVITIAVQDFRDVFAALTVGKRRFSARLLRQLKEQVYELVLNTERQDRLYVQDLEADADASQIDVVIGVGIKDRLATTGYVGLGRRDLLLDVLEPQSTYDAKRVVDEALPSILKHPGNTPMYRYLRAAKLLDTKGVLKDASNVDRLIARRAKGRKPYGPAEYYRKRGRKIVLEAGDLEGLINSGTVDDVLNYAGLIPEDQVSLSRLRDFLRDNKGLFDSAQSAYPTQWAKLVCLYDWYKFGAQLTDDEPPSPPRRVAARGK